LDGKKPVLEIRQEIITDPILPNIHMSNILDFFYSVLNFFRNFANMIAGRKPTSRWLVQCNPLPVGSCKKRMSVLLLKYQLILLRQLTLISQ
jgi:hypothetical protein